MTYVINDRKPEKVFRFFEDLCAIPHGSGNESGIADYIENFAKNRGLEYLRDKVNNMFVRIPATKGYENIQPILLQGHMDMVCEKNSDVQHDFLRDGLKLYIENGKYLRARGTTLGGDDGIAVAMMLSILDGQITDHPEIECLFTVEEETGLLGATSFDYSVLHSRRLLNLDSEEENVVTVGCAGGSRTDITFTGEKTMRDSSVRVSVTGLCGGHSGAEIHKGRVNANKLMGRLLADGSEVTEVLVSDINGGSKDNAIPRECFATVSCGDPDKFIEKLNGIIKVLPRETGKEDQGLTVTLDKGGECLVFDKKVGDGIVALISAVPNGVLEMSHNIDGLVEYSRNLGVIVTDENKVRCTFSSRSAIESQIDQSVSQLQNLAGICGGCAVSYARYPGWSYNPDSPLRDAYLEEYRKIFGELPEVTVIHAGLECGIISSRVPDMDMISIGPNMRAIHSPDEALDLDSCERFFKVVENVIKRK